MSYVVVDYSLYTKKTNTKPPETGNFEFRYGDGNIVKYEGTLKDAVNTARRAAKKAGVSTVVLTDV